MSHPSAELSTLGTATDGVRAKREPATRSARGATLAAALVAARLALLLLPLLLAEAHALPARTGRVVIPDATRYQQVLTHPGRPYRDFPVEYPPALLGAARVLHGSTVVGTLVRLGFFSLVLDVGVAWLLWVGWGRDTALAYLVLGLPLAFFVYFRLDLLSVALALLGMWLIRRRREVAGGVGLALASFTKIWPLALVPLLAARRRWRGAVVAAGSIAVGLVLWVAWGGPHGPTQVLTLRGATGWQVEGFVGSIQWALFGATPRFELGALRVGHVSTPAAVLSLLAGLAVLAVVYVRSSRTSASTEGIPALAATTTLVLVAPVLSPQYLCWLLPWAAISTGLRDRALLAAVGFVTFLTGAMWWLPRGSDAVFKAAVLARNGGLVLMLGMCLMRLWRRESPAEPEGASLVPVQVRGTYT